MSHTTATEVRKLVNSDVLVFEMLGIVKLETLPSKRLTRSITTVCNNHDD